MHNDNRSVPPARRSRRSPLGVAGTLALGSAIVLAGCAAPVSEEPDPSGPVELTVLNQSRGSEAALVALAEQYSEETGNTVTVETPGPSDYLAALQSRAQSNDMPDIFSAILASDMAPYYKAGWALDLSEELGGEWGDNFVPSIVEMATFSEGNTLDVPAGIYGAYWDIQTNGLLINPANVDITAADPPATLSDFIDAVAEGAQNGKGSFWVASTVSPQLITSYASNYLTDEEISATFAGEASWETEEWRKTFQVIIDFAEAGAITNNSLPGGTDDNPTVEKAFFNTQDVGAIFDGSGAIGVATATAPDFTEYFSLPFPAADDGVHDARAAGAPGKGMAINAKGAHTEASLDFLKWLTAPEQQQYFAENSGALPTNPELLEGGALPEQVQGFAATLATLQVVTSPIAPSVRDVMGRGCQSLVLGEITVDQLLADLQAAQDAL